MKKYTELLLNRLDAAYRNRFDRDAALIFLNDAYQEYVFVRTTQADFLDEAEIFQEFMEIRDLFICQLMDRYPSNYAEIKQKIDALKGTCTVIDAPTNLQPHLAF
ncbi:MAG: hypothetical protein ACK5MW_02570 [Enterococcus sp.]